MQLIVFVLYQRRSIYLVAPNIDLQFLLEAYRFLSFYLSLRCVHIASLQASFHLFFNTISSCKLTQSFKAVQSLRKILQRKDITLKSCKNCLEIKTRVLEARKH